MLGSLSRSKPTNDNDQCPADEDFSSGKTQTLPSVFFTLILPAALLALLIIAPPHAFDLAVSKGFYADGWPWHGNADVALWLHKAPKALPVAVGLMALGICATLIAQGRQLLHEERGRRAFYTFVAMSLCGIAVWWLKGTTGVSCPWSVDAFGGTHPITDPSFSFTFRPGNCWPAGHAGTGFCLFALYFALRGVKPCLARAAFVFALLFGLLCGGIRVMQGAHFASHVIASGLIDWMICAAVAVLFFRTPARSDRTQPAAQTGAGTLTGGRTVRKAALGTVTLVLGTALWWTLVFDAPFFRDLTVTIPGLLGSLKGFGAVIGLSAAFFALSAALITVLTLFPRRLCRLLLIALTIAGAGSMAGGVLYGMIFTPDMAKNFLATDTREALGYVSPRTVVLFIAAVLPPVYLALTAELPKRGLKPAACRAGAAVLMLFVGLGFILLNMQSYAGWMRTNKTLRYEIAPVNVFYSGASALLRDPATGAAVTKTKIDPAATLTVKTTKPAVLLFVVGETTRSANWGLAGYERDTTPELAKLKLISVPRAEACGTSTDVSLPCMMSRIGRSNYDRSRILTEEALPGFLQFAGANVIWVDNQSGCKGTCEGVTVRKPAKNDRDCPKGECFDGVFLSELDSDLKNLPTDRPTVLFYHMMGQHGPDYKARSPKSEKPWTPECQSADLGSCTREAIRNAYDNGVRHTDRVLAGLIRKLQANPNIDTAFVYASDHGESLGEQGLFLHGAPQLVAPAVQTEVPMVFWVSEGWEKTFGVSRKALADAASGRVTHEHLFSTVLGMLAIRTGAARAEWDLTGKTRELTQ